MFESCAFTGHRRAVGELDVVLLERVILNLIKSGVKNFYCGMAIGFDLIAAECVLNLKKSYDIKLFACIPCDNQEESYSAKNAEKYERILKSCDGEIVLAPSYFKGCMQQRDRFMVDNCDTLISFLRKDKGGTFYTVNYAKSKNLKIIEL